MAIKLKYYLLGVIQILLSLSVMTILKILAVREALGVSPDQIMILTVGGDAASKGAQEVMQALAIIDTKAPDWKYVCKVWPQPPYQRSEHGRSGNGDEAGN